MNLTTFNQWEEKKWFVEILDYYCQKSGKLILIEKKNDFNALKIINKEGLENIKSVCVND
mgnify:CR=1 FL=1